MVVRSATLVRARSAGAGTVVVATVPVGETWIIKNTQVWNESAGTVGCNLWVQDPALTIYGTFCQLTLNPGSGGEQSTYTVAQAGDQIKAGFNIGGLVVWISGSKLH